MLQKVGDGWARRGGELWKLLDIAFQTRLSGSEGKTFEPSYSEQSFWWVEKGSAIQSFFLIFLCIFPISSRGISFLISLHWICEQKAKRWKRKSFQMESRVECVGEEKVCCSVWHNMKWNFGCEDPSEGESFKAFSQAQKPPRFTFLHRTRELPYQPLLPRRKVLIKSNYVPKHSKVKLRAETFLCFWHLVSDFIAGTRVLKLFSRFSSLPARVTLERQIKRKKFPSFMSEWNIIRTLIFKRWRMAQLERWERVRWESFIIPFAIHSLRRQFLFTSHTRNSRMGNARRAFCLRKSEIPEDLHATRWKIASAREKSPPSLCKKMFVIQIIIWCSHHEAVQSRKSRRLHKLKAFPGLSCPCWRKRSVAADLRGKCWAKVEIKFLCVSSRLSFEKKTLKLVHKPFLFLFRFFCYIIHVHLGTRSFFLFSLTKLFLPLEQDNLIKFVLKNFLLSLTVPSGKLIRFCL